MKSASIFLRESSQKKDIFYLKTKKEDKFDE